MQKIINNVKISAIATCVPKRQVNIFDNKKIYGGNEKKLKRIVNETGFLKRHILEENSNITAADLCQKAAEEIFNNGFNRNDIDAIIMVTQYPDYFGPATACVLHGKLGLKEDCLAFDINQGCAGYIYGVLVGAGLISKTCNKILLLVGDTPTKSNGNELDAVDDIPIFGDGGSATILEYDEDAEDIIFDMGTQGVNYDAIIARNGGFKNYPKKDMFDKKGNFDYGHEMDGLKVFDFTMNIVPPSITKVMEVSKNSDKNIDYYVFHQANKMIMQNIAISANIDVNKVLVETLSKYGNLSCASIPSVICDEDKKFNNQVNNVVMSGFGVGLSWGSAYIKLDKPKILPIIYF